MRGVLRSIWGSMRDAGAVYAVLLIYIACLGSATVGVRNPKGEWFLLPGWMD